MAPLLFPHELNLLLGRDQQPFAAENGVQYRDMKVPSDIVSGVLDSKQGICVTGVLVL